jgi:sugar lactone lactonase YvrE
MGQILSTQKEAFADVSEAQISTVATNVTANGGLIVIGSTIYFLNSWGRSIQSVSSAGLVTTVIDGTSSYLYPQGISASPDGTTVYFGDGRSNSVQKLINLSPTSASQSLFASNLSWPSSVVTDSAGNIYVGDQLCIRKITPSGAVTVFAGNTQSQGMIDGVGTNATFYFPNALAIDKTRNIIYVTESSNKIRKIDIASATVSTLAGVSNTRGYADGPVSTAQFTMPNGLALSPDGSTLYVLEPQMSRLRAISSLRSNPVVSTLIGASGQAGATDGPLSIASLSNPGAITIDTAGNLYVSDAGNSKIRKITLSASACLTGTVCGDLQTPIQTASKQVNSIVSDIKSAISTYGNSDSTTLLFTKEVNDMNRKSRAYDVMFEEEEVKAQGSGKKTRRQTLQEFVLFFFFCCFAIFAASIVMFSYLENGSDGAFKTAVLMVLITFVLVGFIIQLA